MAMVTPVADGGSRPIDVGVVELKPGDAQNDGIQGSANNIQLYEFVVIAGENQFQGLRFARY